MKIIFIILIIALAGFFGRKINSQQKSEATSDTFIFGVEGGLRPGNYSYFKIQNERIYSSKAYTAGQDAVAFNTDPLASEKYMIAKKLKENFPDYLLAHPNQTFGCPNCADQGGIHLEMEHNGTLQTWDIDTNTNQQPIEIRSFIEKVLKIISEL